MRASLLLVLLLLTGCVTGPDDDDSTANDDDQANDDDSSPPSSLTLDEVQARCTHNSYHIEPDLPFDASHRYTHASLDVQLEEQGVRGFELDLHLGDDDLLRVYHIPVIDSVTTCELFADCLQLIRDWSDDHQGHHPIFVWMELKDDIDVNKITDYDALDEVIRSVFPPDRLLEPDDVRGEFSSLREALTEEGWPRIDLVRGQTMFLLLESGEHAENYSQNYQTLEGRPIFVQTGHENFDVPIASVAKINNAGSTDIIADAVKRRLLVASNIGSADGTDEENAAKRSTALDSGANMLCDDFPAPVDGRSYWLDMPDGAPSRCNPLRARDECTSEGLESLN